MPLTSEQKEMVKTMRVNGIGYLSIANEIGASRDQVRWYCKSLGLVGIKVELFEVSCNECATTFNQKIVGQKFCSERCRGRYNKKHKGRIRECIYCHKEFNSYKDKKSCSAECKKEHELSVRIKKQEEKETQRKEKEVTKLINSLHNILAKTKTCTHCKKEYILRKNVSGHKYCSDECKDKGYRNRNRLYRKWNRIYKDARWTTNGKADYSITLEELHERDNGICYLCNKPTDYNDFVMRDNNIFIAGNNYPTARSSI